jgi:hypothetical protein
MSDMFPNGYFPEGYFGPYFGPGDAGEGFVSGIARGQATCSATGEAVLVGASAGAVSGSGGVGWWRRFDDAEVYLRLLGVEIRVSVTSPDLVVTVPLCAVPVSISVQASTPSLSQVQSEQQVRRDQRDISEIVEMMQIRKLLAVRRERA